MELVIDAQIVKAYYEEDVTGVAHNLTNSPIEIFDRIGGADRANIDDGGHIEAEWRNLVDPEWFDAWLAHLLISDAVRMLPTTACIQLRRQLRSFGFPTHGAAGRDFWHVRVAIAVREQYYARAGGRHPLVYIISEDMHFFSPQEYGTASGPRRLEILLSGSAPVVRFLRRRQRIEVCCVADYPQLT